MPFSIGQVVVELTANSATFRQEMDKARQDAAASGKAIKGALDEAGKSPGLGAVARSAQQSGNALRTLSNSARAAAQPLARELGPSFGQTASQMLSMVSAASAVSGGLAGVALIGTGLAGILVTKVVTAFQESTKAKEDFDKAMRSGDLGVVSSQVKTLAEQILNLNTEINKLKTGPALKDVLKPSGVLGDAETQQMFEFFRRRKEAQQEAAGGRLTEALGMQDVLKGIQDQAALEEQGARQRQEIETKFREDEVAARKKAAEDAAEEEKKLRAQAIRDTAESIDVQLKEEEDALRFEAQLRDQAAAENQARIDEGTRSTIEAVDDQVEAEETALREIARIQDERAAEQQELIDAGTRSTIEAIDAQLAAEEEALRELARIQDERVAEAQAKQEERVREFAQVFENAFDRVTDEIVGAFVRGEAAALKFGDVVRGILASIAADLIKLAIRKAIVAGVGAAVGAITTTSTTTVTDVPATATGGIVTKPQVRLVGEAGPEAIVPLSTYGGMGGVTVNVINQSGAQIETNESTGPDGERMLDILVTRKVDQAIARGSFDRTMGTVYGVKRRGVSR